MQAVKFRERKKEGNTFIQGKEQQAEIKPFYWKAFIEALTRFSTKDSSTAVRPQMTRLLPEKEMTQAAVNQSLVSFIHDGEIIWL